MTSSDRVVGSDFDITERTRLEEEVRRQAQEIKDQHERLASLVENVEAQRALLEAIFENMPVGITYFDANMRVIYANARYEQLLGTPRDAAIGQIVYDVSAVAKERRPLFERALA